MLYGEMRLYDEIFDHVITLLNLTTRSICCPNFSYQLVRYTKITDVKTSMIYNKGDDFHYCRGEIVLRGA